MCPADDADAVDKIIETVHLAQEALAHHDVASGKDILGDVEQQIQAYKASSDFGSDDLNLFEPETFDEAFDSKGTI